MIKEILLTRHDAEITQRQVDQLVKSCVEQHCELNPSRIAEAVYLGASSESCEHAVKELTRVIQKKYGNGESSGKYHRETLLKVLEFSNSLPHETVDTTIKVIFQDLMTEQKKSCDPKGRDMYWARLVKIGPSKHIADYIVQELVHKKIWAKEDIHLVAQHCSSMLLKSWTQELLDEVMSKEVRISTGRCGYPGWQVVREEQIKTLKKLAHIVIYTDDRLINMAIEELLAKDLADEAIDLAKNLKK